jgi:hypothetical protein
MTCVYTGALVRFADYGMTVRCDLYRVGDCIIVRWTKGSEDYDPEMFPHCSHVIDLRSGDWFRNDICVAVTEAHNVTGEFR